MKLSAYTVFQLRDKKLSEASGGPLTSCFDELTRFTVIFPSSGISHILFSNQDTLHFLPNQYMKYIT